MPMTPQEEVTEIVDKILKEVSDRWGETALRPNEETDHLFQQIEEKLNDTLETLQLALKYDGVTGKNEIVCKETGKILKNVQSYELHAGNRKEPDRLTVTVILPRPKKQPSPPPLAHEDPNRIPDCPIDEAFQRLADLCGDTWDDVNPVEYVRELRGYSE